MKLRDEFAKQALQGLMSGSGRWKVAGGRPLQKPIDFGATAYEIADAMLEARRANVTQTRPPNSPCTKTEIDDLWFASLMRHLRPEDAVGYFTRLNERRRNL